jgi:hypothetical protein
MERVRRVRWVRIMHMESIFAGVDDIWSSRFTALKCSLCLERELENSIYHVPRREMFVFCSLFFMQTEKKAVSSGVSVTADANVNAKTI